MALKTRNLEATKYVKIKDGKFYLYSDKENVNAFDELEGLLTDIYLKDDTYEGQTVRKLYIVLKDGDEKFIVGFSLESSYTSSFLSFIQNADVTKPITLVPLIKTKTVNGKEVSSRSILICQNGTFMKSYFTKDTPHGLPAMKKIKVSGKELWDKTDMLEFYENLIVTKLKPKLMSEPQVVIAEVADEVDVTLPWNKDVTDEDLPF